MGGPMDEDENQFELDSPINNSHLAVGLNNHEQVFYQQIQEANLRANKNDVNLAAKRHESSFEQSQALDFNKIKEGA